MNDFLRALSYNLQVYSSHKKIKSVVTAGILALLFGLWIVLSSIQLQSSDIAPYSAGVYSICNMTTIVFYSIFNFSVLFCAYIFQEIETESNFEIKTYIFPITFIHFFFSRLTIIIFLTFIFGVIYLIACNLLLFTRFSIPKSFNLSDYMKVFIVYWRAFFLASFGYISIVVLSSFYIKKSIIGFIVIFVCYMLSFFKEFSILPFSFAYNNLRILDTLNLYPESFLKNESNNYLLYSNIIVLIVIVVVYFNIIKYDNIKLKP